MNDTALSNQELNLTQKIQMHFPRGISPDVLREWIGCPTSVLMAQLLELFGKLPDFTEERVKKIQLFDHVTDLNFPGMDTFNTDSFFTTDTPEGATTKFTSVGSNFTNWFGDMEVSATAPSKLSLDRLRVGSCDPDIVTDIGDENCDQSLAIIRWHIQSGLATKEGYYAGYFRDKVGIRRAVFWFWVGHGRSVHAHEVPHRSRWLEGNEFLSRKPPKPSAA